jgi:hypothetical protein
MIRGMSSREKRSKRSGTHEPALDGETQESPPSPLQKDLDWGDVLSFDSSGLPISPAARKLSGLEPLSPPPGKRWVDVLDVELDYTALVDAYLARQEHKQLPEAGTYWKTSVELLEQVLGFSLDAPAVSPGLVSSLEAHAKAQRIASSLASRLDRAEAIACAVGPEHIVWELQTAAHAAIAMHARVSPPFVFRYEGLPHPFLGKFERAHRPAFDILNTGLRRACRELLADVVRTLDPDIVGKRVRKTQLFDLGLAWWEPDAVLEGFFSY